jgi:hypothetical protein
MDGHTRKCLENWVIAIESTEQRKVRSLLQLESPDEVTNTLHILDVRFCYFVAQDASHHLYTF